jgi:hypothetical protein
MKIELFTFLTKTLDRGRGRATFSDFLCVDRKKNTAVNPVSLEVICSFYCFSFLKATELKGKFYELSVRKRRVRDFALRCRRWLQENILGRTNRLLFLQYSGCYLHIFSAKELGSEHWNVHILQKGPSLIKEETSIGKKNF